MAFSHIAIAHIKPTSSAARQRFLDIFPKLVSYTKTSEPDTLAYYFFQPASPGPEDHSLVGFEAYTSEKALLQVHAKSDPYLAQSSIIKAENLCDVIVDSYTPGPGFMLRWGEKENPVGLIVVANYKLETGANEKFLKGLAILGKKIEKDAGSSCKTFISFTDVKNKNSVVLFARFIKREGWEEIKKEINAQGVINEDGGEYKELGIGFLTK